MNLKESNSQYFQDVEAAKVCDIKNGFYLDIGCYEPKIWSNTYSLEKELNWSGILIDIDADLIKKCKEERSSKNSIVCADLLEVNINEILESHNCPQHIDYISFDVDAATIQVVQDFDFRKYSFTFCTFEHDLYRDGPHLKNLSKNIFSNYGYEIYRENVEATGNGPNPYFEDWYIKK